jgi:Domain of unknown function (DUF4340)
MSARRLLVLAAAALIVAGLAVWVSVASRPERPAPGGRPVVLQALAESLDSVNEVRLARGDGAATTLQRRDNGWFVAQRNYPADPNKLRSLLISLSGLRTIEQKTSDPARYATLNVEDATGAQSHSVRIDVVAGQRTWSLLLGKPAEPNGSFVRIPGAAAALSVEPRIEADPQPARWIMPGLLDVAADRIEHVSVRPAGDASYWLDRTARGAADLTLHGVPPGRKPAGPGVVDSVAGVLARLNVEDVKERAPGAPAHPSQASYLTFEGLQLDLDGYRDGPNAWIRVHASVDPATAKRFASTRTEVASAKGPDHGKGSDQGKAAEQSKAPEQPKAPDQAKAPEVKTPDATAEAAAINERAQPFDFQIPVYQYDQIFRPLKDLLAPPPQPTSAAPKEHK